MSANRQVVPTPKGQTATPQDSETIMDTKAIEAWKVAIDGMTFNQLVQMEFKLRPQDKWMKMFVNQTQFAIETVKCDLCQTGPSLSRLPCIKQHINGRKHQTKLKTAVCDMRHTHINPLKSRPKNQPPQKAAPAKPANSGSSVAAKPANAGSSTTAKPANAGTAAAAKPATSGTPVAAKPANSGTSVAAKSANSGSSVAAKPANSGTSVAAKPASAGTSPVFKTPNSGTAVKPASTTTTPVKPATPGLSKQVNDGGNSKIVLNPLSVQKKQAEDKNQNDTNKNQEEELKKFRASMSNLNNADLMLIEYKFVNTDWQKLFKKEVTKGVATYTCSMCKTPIPKLTEIKSHMANRQHQRNIDLVKGLHHPKLLPLKTATNAPKPAEKTNKPEVSSDPKKDGSGSVGNTKTTVEAKKVQSNTSAKETNIARNENTKSNVVINPVYIQKQTMEATTTGKNLRELLKTLEVVELLKIEFRYSGINSEWKKMFTQFPDTTFKCLLCGTFLIKNLRDLRTHIESVRHQSSISATQKLYHPTLAPTKSETEELSKGVNKSTTQIQKDAPKKMNDKEFSEYIPKLNLNNLKKVEFLLNGRWKPLIIMQGHFVMCNLCDVRGISSEKTLASHIAGKKHAELMSSVQKLYHPDHTVAKEQNANFNKSSDNVPPKKTVQPGSDSDVVCTIMVEDSPEREIVNTNVRRNNDKVVNPAAIIAKSNEQRDNSVRFPHQQLNDNNSNMNNRFGMQTGNIQQTADNENRFRTNNNFQKNVMTAQQAERTITPRVRPFQDSTNKDNPVFSTKDLTSSKVEEVEGFIGVEYVVKILRNVNDTMPRFECCLCEVEVDGVGMQFHLKGLLHRKKYLERHFPTAIRQFSKYKEDPKYSFLMSQICEKLAMAVEKYHGRDLPFECLSEEFRSNRDGIMSKVFSFRHAAEHSGPSFTNVVDKNMIDQFISNKDNYKAPQPDPKRRPTFDVDRNAPQKKVQSDGRSPTLGVEEHRVLVEKFLQNTTLNTSQRPRDRHHRSRSRSPRRRRSRSRSPHPHNRNRSPPKSKPPARSQWELYSHILKSPVRGNTGNIWDRYRQMFDHGVEDLDRDYKEYKRDPEKHPLYDEEWRKYWVKKSRTLRDEGIDPSSYNFQPGWVRFFSRRVHQLYEEEVEQIRLKCRDRLKLPHHNNLLRDERYHIGVHCVADPVSDEEDEIPDKPEPVRQPQQQPLEQRNPYMQNVQYPSKPTQMNVQQPSIPFNRGQPEYVNQMTPVQDQSQAFNQGPTNERSMMGRSMNERSLNERSMNERSMNERLINERSMMGRSMNDRSMMGRSMNERPTNEHPMNVRPMNERSMNERSMNERSMNERPMNERSMNERPIGRPTNERSVLDLPVSERPKTIIEYAKPDDDEKKDVVAELGIETGPLNAVSILRLLTALEDQLGSLGPKVIDLLSKALTLEKVKPNSADDSLLTMENCVFLETVNEKLKGQILAGVIEGSKMKAVKQAIKDLTVILKKSNENLANNPPPPPLIHPREAPKPPKPPAPKRPAPSTTSTGPAQKVQCLDKQEIASKLAAALAAQGKTDFSAEQLEQLVAVYTLIEKKQREASNKSESSSDPQKKSLSETLLDFLKPAPVASGGGPNLNVVQPTRQPEQSSMSSISSMGQMQTNRNQPISNSNSSMMGSSNRMRGDNYSNNPLPSLQQSTSQRAPQSSALSFLGSYNFGQLSNFDTSLNLSSLNRNSSINPNSYSSNSGSNQTWRNMDSFSSSNMNKGSSSMNMNQISSNISSLNLSSLIQGITSRGQNSSNIGYGNQGSSSLSKDSNIRSGQSFNQNQSTQNSSYGFNSNQAMERNRSDNRDDFSSNQRADDFSSNQRGDDFSSNQRGGDQRFSRSDQDERQAFNSDPVVTSTSMQRGGGGGGMSGGNRSNPFSGNTSNNPSMVSYPSNNIWRNQANVSSQNNSSSFRGDNQTAQTPMGWQRSNVGGRR